MQYIQMATGKAHKQQKEQTPLKTHSTCGTKKTNKCATDAI